MQLMVASTPIVCETNRK